MTFRLYSSFALQLSLEQNKSQDRVKTKSENCRMLSRNHTYTSHELYI